MALFERRSPAKALADYLDKERQAVLNGNYNALEGMFAEKQRLLEAVAKDFRAARLLPILRAKSERNNSLLQVAAQGIRHAQKHLTSVLKETPLRTYGPDGIRTGGKSPRSLERRA